MRIFRIKLFLLAFVISSCSNDELEVNIKSEQDLKHYLQSRNNNYIFKDFISEKDKYKKLPKPIYFESITELDEFLRKMDDLKTELVSRHSFTHAPPEDGGGNTEGSEGYFRDTFYIGGFGVYMNVGFNFNGCEGSNLNSWLSGFQLGASYDHMGGTLSTYNNSRINYYVDGVLHYNIFVEGIGTIFSENVTYSGYKNCN